MKVRLPRFGKGPNIGTRAELELLLICARRFLDSRSAERIKTLVQEDINWLYLVQTAFAHGVLSLLYWHLNATCSENVPKATLDQLRDHFHVSARHNFLLARELLRLLNLFREHGIAAIPYKGPVLAVSVYGNLALRQFGDLDIVIHKRDILKAKDMVISQGYRPHHVIGASEATYLQTHYHLSFERIDDGLCVELHWAFTEKYWAFSMDLASLQEPLEQIFLVGSRVPNLPQQDLLLILCAHGAKHHWERLGWICDVAELVRRQRGLDWEKLLVQADRLRSRRILFLGLFLARDLLGATLPEKVWRSVQTDSVVPSLGAQVYQQLFAVADRETKKFDYTFYPRTRERLRDRLRYFCQAILPGYLRHLPTVMIPSATDRTVLPLPASLAFLYYLLRPVRLIGVHGSRLTRILLKVLAGF